MKKLLFFLKKHYFAVIVLLIICLAVFLRFYDFTDRWGFAYDQAHDVVVSRFAVSHFKLPFLGPFSSAGPFQTGGEWYWFVMLGSIFVPFFVNGPWVFLVVIQIAFVGVMAIVGRKLLGEWFGITAALLSCVSPSLINQSINLTNQAPLAIIGLLAIAAAISYIRKGSPISLFFLGLCIGLGSSIHLQGIALILLLFMTIFITGIPSFKAIGVLLLGLLLPWIPVFVNDSANHFFNTKNMIQYYLHDQYKIPLEAFGRRWLTYAGVFWPNSWANIIGVNRVIGYVLSIGSILAVLFCLFIKKIRREWLVLFLSFIAMVIMLRYLRAPLFDSYLMFISPFVLLFSSLFIYLIARKQKIIGIVILCIIIGFSLNKTLIDIKNSKNEMALRTQFWMQLLVKKYPNQKFAIYDYQYRTSGFSIPLVMYMQYNNLLDNNGYKIGFGNPSEKDDPKNAHSFAEIKGNTMGFNLMDINSSTSAQLTKSGWAQVNPSFIYKSTEEWYLYK